VTKETLIAFAAQFPLDQAAFASCLNDNKSLAQVQADAEEGQKVGVRGTPSFLINGKLLVGAQPLAAFEKAIADAQAPAN
jgi:protein-disulfide isomerase